MNPIKRLFLLYIDVNRKINDKNISAHASSAAFFIFLSIMPIFMVLSTLIRLTPITEAFFIETITEVIPPAFQSFLTSLAIQAYRTSAGAISVAILVTLWSAGMGCLALIRGFNAIYGVTERRNYFVLRIQACIYTVIMVLMVVITLGFLVFGEVITTLLLNRLPELEKAFNLFKSLRYPVGFLILTLFIALLYMYMPNKKLKFKYQLPGAIVAAIIWVVFSWAYSLYIITFGMSSAYGSLSVIVTLMFWMYFLIYFMMIGAYLNCYFFPMYKVIYKRSKIDNFREELVKKAEEKIESLSEDDKKEEDYRFKIGKSNIPFADEINESIGEDGESVNANKEEK